MSELPKCAICKIAPYTWTDVVGYGVACGSDRETCQLSNIRFTESEWRALMAPAGYSEDLEMWIVKEIALIEDDSRHHYKPALVHINAPLALIQLGMKSRLQVLKQVQSLNHKDDEKPT